MSPTLSWILAAVILANIIGCLWLLLGTSNKAQGDSDDHDHVWDEDIQELNNPMPRWWLWMFILSIVFSLGYLVLYPGLGGYEGTLEWSGQQELQAKLNDLTADRHAKLTRLAEPALEAISNNPEALAQGAALFSQYCAGCHGANAQGAVGFPNLADNDWLYGGEPETILHSIAKGRTGAMPAFKTMLTQAQMDTVAAYIQQWPDTPSSPAEKAGHQLFSQRCGFCHGQRGEGNTLFGAPRLNDNIWLFGGDRQTLVQTISEGRSGQMPAHENLMTKAELRLVAAWVYHLSQPQ